MSLTIPTDKEALLCECSNTGNLCRHLDPIPNNPILGFTTDNGLREAMKDASITSRNLTCLKKTVCAVFEGNYEKPQIIDGLLTERISDSWDQNSIYLLIEDGSNENLRTNNNFENIKIISRSKTHCKILENSLFTFYRLDHINLLNQKKANYYYDPDLIVLVLKTPTQLDNTEIKKFLSAVEKKYKNGNIILVLNNSENQDCIKFDKCTRCYPQPTVNFLKETQIDWNNKIFKVSTVKFEDNKFENLQPDPNSNKFRDLRQVIEKELDLEKVIQKLVDQAFSMKQNLCNIDNLLDSKTLKNSIFCFTASITKNSKNLIQLVDDCEQKALDNILKGNNTTNDDLLKNILQTYKDVKITFQNELSIFRKNVRTESEVEIVEKIVNNILFKNVLNDEEIENSLKDSIENHTVKKDSTDGELRPISKDIVFNICRDIFSVITTKINVFLKDMQKQALENINNFKKLIGKGIQRCDEYQLISNINKYKTEFRLSIRDKGINMENKLKECLEIIKTQINKREKSNIFPKYLGFFILDVIYKIRIELDITSFVENINTLLGSTEPYRAEDKFQKLQSQTLETQRLVESCEDQITIFLGTLNDEKFYENQPNKRFIKKTEVLKHYELLEDCIFGRVTLIFKNLSDLSTPFVFE